MWREILEIHTANFVFNEARGREASGLAVIQEDGTYRIFKQPVEASDLVGMEGYQETLAMVNDRTVCVLGHTRMPTKGSRWRNVNNHPIQAGQVIGIHNGIIANDDQLFVDRRLPRNGEVDSEIIFQLVNSVDPAQWNGRYLQKIQGVVDNLEGTFATLSMDLRNPGRLLVLKHLRPLCIHYEEEWQALFFSSRYIFLRKAFGRQVISEALDSGYGYIYNAQELHRMGNQPLERFEIQEDYE